MIPRHMQITFAILLVAVIGMGIYFFKLKQRAENHAAKANAAAPLAPATGPTTDVTLRIAYDSDGSLVSRPVSATLPTEATERDRAILRLLLAEYKKADATHHLGADADVNTVFLLSAAPSATSGTAANGDVAASGEAAKGTTAVVDLSEALAKSQPSGILLEELTLESMAQTLHANSSDIVAVRFLVDGQERETLAGHADLHAAYAASF